ncbi:hypothetical protein Leryth_015994 [Lithospermum erythrorhizon]|nr:hypothetical protein Leryth_015994 [Lithospermum erythrorhizon]
MASNNIIIPFFLISLTIFQSNHLVFCHQESGEWHCDEDSETKLTADFRPGIVTVDGHADDWEDINGFDFSLLPALDPDQEHEYKAGKMTIKALHDGRDVYFMLKVDGDYVYSDGNDNKCPSVALMFQVGDSATYHNMGGCKESPGTCNNKTCRGYEVDIMHFSVGSAIPGRIYGANPVDNRDGNGGDRYGHLLDMYAWNPHCRNLDGISPAGNDSTAQNNWKGAWWHSSFGVHSGYIREDSPYGSSGQKGTYYFEFSRPLRTMDQLQQDIQFTVGQPSKFAAAFWYPVDGNPWHGSGHYSINCNWVALDVSSASLTPVKLASGNSWNASGAFALLLSIISLSVSIFVGYLVSRKSGVHFTPMDSL